MRHRFIFALLLLLASVGFAAAQETTTGSITGEVTDAQGAPVPGATVTVTSGQGSKSTVTDAEGRFIRIPDPQELLEAVAPNAAYVHVTTNETIQGVEYPATPIVPDDIPLVADASSDFLAGPIDVGRFGLLYAGAQKNAGPAGVTIVIVRDDLLERIPSGLPSTLDYRTYVEHRSLFNTPPVFGIYVVMLVTRWLRDDVGGVTKMGERNREKAELLYERIDGAPSFYRGHADAGSRSLMNVTFRLPSEELDAAFVSEASERGMVELRGHRSIGGIRASIYNAMPVEGVEALAAFMDEFHERHGPSFD